MLHNQTPWSALAEAQDAPIIRHVQMSDLDAVLDLHMVAFQDKFKAAFGARHIVEGRNALVMAHRLQGQQSLVGMYMAEVGTQVVGTITLRTWDMFSDEAFSAERAFYETLGFWRTMRALFMLVRVDHTI